MRSSIILAAACVIIATSAYVSRAVTSVVGDDARRLTVEVSFGDRESLGTLAMPGAPAIRYERIFVVVPPGAMVRAQRIDGDFTDGRELPERGGAVAGVEYLESAGLFPREAVRVSEPFTFRRSRVVAVDCFASQVDYEAGVHRQWSRYRVDISYIGPAGTTPSDPMLMRLVANDGVLSSAQSAPNFRSRPVPDPHFSLSPNWIKIRIREPGVYKIDGTALAGAGVSLMSIADPNSFRLFTVGGRELNVDLSETGTWQPGTWADECDILVEYGGDGTFDPADRIIFYALPSEAFGDLYEPGLPREAYQRHQYTTENYYYLTWDSGFSGPPARMATADASPTGGQDSVTTFQERLYFEQDEVDDYNFGGDGWLWYDVTPKTGTETFPFPAFNVYDLVGAQTQTFRTVALAKVREGNNINHHAVYLINGNFIGDKVWNTGGGHRFENGQPVEIAGTFLSEGTNVFSLSVPRDLNPTDHMYFAWYSVLYHRALMARGDRLLFSSPDSIGPVTYSVGRFSDPASQLYVFDVSDAVHPVRLTAGTGSSDADGYRLRFEASVGPTRRAYYWTSTADGMMSPASMARYFPTDLRNKNLSPHMVIVTDGAFSVAANRLRQHRLQNLPLAASPRVEVVTATEVYDNFSGGQVDPMAIRNYAKFLYDNYSEPGGGPSLMYLLLVGDANADFKNNRNQQPNFVPTTLNLNPYLTEAYATDDLLALLDASDYADTSHAFIDVAIGRLPAASASEADLMVDKTIGYERDAEFGDWRDRVILVADDEISSTSVNQSTFIVLSESLAHGWLAPYLDVRKLYLTEYPAIQGIKPASRLQFLEDWNAGSIIINYVGHGSSVQMADEQVFLASDVGNLNNGLRLPVFTAFSCTIGNFAAAAKSLSERLVLRQGGGVVATLTASELTYIGPNDNLNVHVFDQMFPDAPGAPVPLGLAILLGKTKSLSFETPGERFFTENHQKYNLLGDPALVMLSPRREIELTPTDIDSLTTGKRHVVRGRVLDGAGQTDVSFNGNVKLVVRETDDQSGYTRESDGFTIPYRYPGGTIYQGTANVSAGLFEFSFKVPRFAETGRFGFVLAYAEDGSADAVDKFHAVVLKEPTPGDPDAAPSDGAPRVTMGFQGGTFQTVKPGAVMEASVNDADGINILGTTPESKLGLLFDDTSLPLDVTEFFEFDHGGVDTSGSLSFPLPDLAVGSHRAILKVADAFGQTRLDTLLFNVTDPLDYSAEIVMNYPNPFEDETHFMIQLTDRAEVRLEIFTLSGRRVRRLEAVLDGGEQWLTWDGRDNSGGSVANGTYLYVARISFEGLDRTPLILRGKVVRID